MNPVLFGRLSFFQDGLMILLMFMVSLPVCIFILPYNLLERKGFCKNCWKIFVFLVCVGKHACGVFSTGVFAGVMI